MDTHARQRAARIAETAAAMEAAMSALRQQAETYLQAVREHGAAIYAEHGPDAPPSGPGQAEAFEAALALARAG